MPAHWTVDLIGMGASSAAGCSVERLLQENWNPDLGDLRVRSIASSEPTELRKFIGQIRPDLILLFLLEAELNGRPYLAVVRNVAPTCPIIAVVPELPAPSLIGLFREGISDFVVAPIRAVDLLPRIGQLLLRRGCVEASVEELKQTMGLGQIVGQSPLLIAELRKLQLVSGCAATVLILGETGTGKELFARAVHYLSPRSVGPFVAVNCGAIPVDLVENELFGHIRGAFTSAMTTQAGLLQEASGGSLFLDEIDSLSLPLQAKLLRFLQDKEYRPLGCAKPLRVDVRVIAASNLVLEEAVRTGRFRQDLYYRINVLSVNLPSLRNRREDIAPLAQHFVDKYAAEFSRPARSLSLGAIDKLLGHSWPGNVRELENAIQRAVLVCGIDTIGAQIIDLPSDSTGPVDESFRAHKAKAIQEFERSYLAAVLQRHDGNISAAARTAHKNRRAFWQLLRKHRLNIQSLVGTRVSAAVPPPIQMT